MLHITYDYYYWKLKIWKVLYALPILCKRENTGHTLGLDSRFLSEKCNNIFRRTFESKKVDLEKDKVLVRRAQVVSAG